MDLDAYTLYAFIRQDLPPGQETIQAIHAAFHAGMAFHAAHGFQPGIPYAVVADTPSLKSLRKALRKVQEANIGYYAMTDTDVDKDMSAIVTFPVDKIQKEVLREYRLRKYTAGAAETSNAGLDASPPPNAPIAQLREHQVYNLGVEGENPSGRSKFPDLCTAEMTTFLKETNTNGY